MTLDGRCVGGDAASPAGCYRCVGQKDRSVAPSALHPASSGCNFVQYGAAFVAVSWRVMASHEFFVLASAHFLCLLSPGPDFFLLVGSTARHGRRHGYGAAVGIACANAGYIACAIAGFWLLTENTTAFALVRWLGATYLGWLGFNLVKSARTPRALETDRGSEGRRTFGSGWLTGFLSGALNPKNGLFYLGVFSFAVSPQTSEPVRVGYGVWMFLVVLVWDALLVRCLTATTALRNLQRLVPKIEGVSGACLLALAIVIVAGAR